MDISKARELLGVGFEHLSDEQVQHLINLLDGFAKVVIQNYMSDK